MKRPIFVVLLGFLLGNIIGLYLNNSIVFFVPIIFLLYQVIKRISRYSKFISKNVCIIIVITSIISNTYVLMLNNFYKNKYREVKEEYIATVVSRKKTTKYYTQYKIKLEDNSYLLLNLKKNTELEYGDKISFSGEYKEPEVARNYKGFSYKEYLKSIGIYGSIKADTVNKIGKGKVSILGNLANKVSNKIINAIQVNIEDEDKGNLILGIILGYDDELSKEIKEDFRNSSLSHILAVSGMHVSYMIFGLSILLTNFKFSKRIIKIITVLFLVFFIFLTGGSPSVKRACIMGIITLGAGIFYKKSDIITNMSASLLIILIQNPFSIINARTYFIILCHNWNNFIEPQITT